MMKKKLLYCLQLLLLINISVQAKTSGYLNATQKVKTFNQAQPLLFSENKGQICDKEGNPRPDILFKAVSGNTTLFLSNTGIYYQFEKDIYPEGYNPLKDPEAVKKQTAFERQVQTQTFVFSFMLQNANPHPVIRKENKSSFVENFYTSAAAENGITNVGNYERVVYENVYPNIDWVVYSNGKHLKYDFIVHPGGDPSLIKWKITDADNIKLDKDGSLLIKTALGEVREKAPQSFADGQPVESKFKQNTDGTISFDIEKFANKTLTIDPYVAWATYYGGPGQDAGSAYCVTDAAGNIFTGGMTLSTSGIASGGFQNTFGGGSNYDAFLVKFDSTGSRLWATYYGGTGDDRGIAGAVDASGDMYVAGSTSSSGMASGGFQNTYGGGTSASNPGDAFLVKFSSAGLRLWATYYGGNNDEAASGCAVDASGNVYLSGSTNSSSGIASGGFQNTYGGGTASSGSGGTGDAFLVKFDATGSRLWATYYGGSDYENGNACTVDASGNVYLAGQTLSSNNIASTGAFQTSITTGTYGGFIAKFNASGSRIWGTYYGNADTRAESCVVDATGNVYIAGHTANNNNNVASAGFQNTFGGTQDAFLAKLNASGVRLWGTYYGGSDYEFGFSTFLDAGGNVYLIGQTLSSTGIASGGLQNTLGGSYDGFVAKFNTAGSRLWGTYYGSTGYDAFFQGTVDAFGSIYLGGNTNSASGVALNGFQNTPGGTADGLLVKLREFCVPDSVTITKTTCSNQLPYIWNGISVPAGGVAVAKDTFMNTIGCDSIVYLNLIVNTPPAIVHVYDTVCSNNFPFSWNGISVALPSGNTTTSTYTVSAANGCDSVTTLHVFVKQASTNTVYQTICSNQLPYTWNNILVTAGGPNAAVFITPNAVNCDSTVTLNLTVHNTSIHTDSVSICSNQLPYTWNSIVVTVGGPSAATYTTTNAVNCDSVVTLNLTVKNTSASTANLTICAGDLPYTWHGKVITSGGANAAADTLVNSVGCDSIVTLNLTVTPAVTPTITITVFPGNNVPLGTAVTYTASVTNGGTAPILQWKKNGINVGGSSASFTDLNVDSADVITCTLWSNAICAFPDSVVSNTITMIVVTPPPPCLVPVTLISTDIQFSSAVFKWASVAGAVGYEITLDMFPGDPSSGMFTTDTIYHASALLPGVHYFHIRTRCSDGQLSAWITITINIQDENGSTGTVNVNGNGSGITLYPNPNNGVFNVQGIVDGNKASLDIIDKSGRIIYRGEAATPDGKLNQHIDLSGTLSAGIYLLRITSGYSIYVLRFVHN